VSLVIGKQKLQKRKWAEEERQRLRWQLSAICGITT